MSNYEWKTKNGSDENPNEPYITVDDFYWNFHKFRTPGTSSPRKSTSIRKALLKRPKGVDADLYKAHVGKKIQRDRSIWVMLKCFWTY